MPAIHWGAVVAAALSSFLLGGLWYSPALFGNAWMRASGHDAASLAKGNQGVIFGMSFVLALITAAVFAMFLGPKPELGFALGAGVAAGIGWVATSFGINYLFERKSFPHFAINAGYHVVQFSLIGLILGVWK